MLKTSQLGLLGAGFLISAFTFVAHADDKPIALNYKYKEGTVSRYKSTITSSVMNMDIIVKQTSKHVVKEVKKNGDVVIEEKNEGTVVTVGGADMEQPAQEKPIVITRDKTGKLIDLKFDSTGQEFMAPEIQKLAAMVGDILLSEKPVKEGDSWNTELENPVVKSKKFSVKSVFIGIDKVDGKNYWKVKQSATVEVDAAGAKTSFDMTQWMEIGTGETFKIEASVKDLPTQFGPVNWTMKVEKLKDEKSKEEKKP